MQGSMSDDGWRESTNDEQRWKEEVAGVQAATQQVERKERRRREERVRQKVRGDGFLEAQREPRVSCVAGWREPSGRERSNEQTQLRPVMILGMRGAKERAVTSVIRLLN
jgi:hypothetical protein